MSEGFNKKYFRWRRNKKSLILTYLDFILKYKELILLSIISIIISLEVIELGFLPLMSTNFMIEVIFFNLIMSFIGLILLYIFYSFFYYFFQKTKFFLFFLSLIFILLFCYKHEFIKCFIIFCIFLYLTFEKKIKIIFFNWFKNNKYFKNLKVFYFKREEIELLTKTFLWIVFLSIVFTKIFSIVLVILIIFIINLNNIEEKLITVSIISILVFTFLILFITEKFNWGLNFMKIGNYYSTLTIKNENNICELLKRDKFNIVYLGAKLCKIRVVKVKFNLSNYYYLDTKKSIFLIPRKLVVLEKYKK